MNYYEILGVGRDATADEIKKAFRKKSIKYHPDRQGGKSDEEKREAERMFKDINEAYQTLSDEGKRRAYDHPNFFDFGGAPRPGTSGYRDMSDIFRQNATRRVVVQGKSVKMVVPVTLQELYNGCHKTLRYDIDKRCPNCHGAGGHGQCKCPTCGGSGLERKHTVFGFMQSPCSRCGGTGSTYKTTCPSCSGTGFRTATTTIDIDIPAGVDDGSSIIYKTKGCESPNPGDPDGDFIVVFAYKYDQERYTVVGKDVVEKVYVDYYDLLLGCEREFQLPNGKTKKIKFDSCTKEGTTVKMLGEGIPTLPYTEQSNNYYLEVHHLFPDELGEQERKLLETLKVEKFREKNVEG